MKIYFSVRRVLVFSVALSAFALAFAWGCGSSPSVADTPTTPVTAVPDIMIGKAEQDKSVALRVGQTLGVRLESNPTTGYEWVIAATDEQKLPQQGKTRFETPATGNEGASTMQILIFQAKTAGSVALRLEYKRPWDKEKLPEKIYNVNINIANE